MRDEIKRTWNEPMRMVFLGLLSIVAVVGIRFLFERTTPAVESRSIAELSHRLDDVADRDKATVRRLEELESAVKGLERQIKQLSSLVSAQPVQPPPGVLPGAPTPSPVANSATVQETMSRGWAYIAKGEFDPNSHNRLLADLVAAYAVPGLAPEQNSALITAIQQVNEIGVTRVIGDVRGLSALDAAQRLRTFLETTPRLTPRQKQRLKTELVAHGA